MADRTRVAFFVGAAAFSLTCCTATVTAEPVTQERVAELAPAERSAWEAYVARSQALAIVEAAALAAEVAAQGMTAALRAPDGGDFKLPAKLGDAWYGGEEARELADTVLSYQTPSGGWSKHTGYSHGPRKPGMQWTSQNKPGDRPHYLATFDNRSTTEQLYFLAGVWHATRREDCKAGFLKGLAFVLAAQYPSGGWPQVYPLEGGYHDAITFNDDAMTRVLGLLHAIGGEDPYYAFLDEGQRKSAAAALAAGIRCVLRTQVRQGDTLTAWCGQHDALTLQPEGARKMEPPTLVSMESARVLKFLMTIPDPSPELATAIERGLAWLEAVKVTGISKTERDGRTMYLSNPDSTEVYWARFYDLADNRPIFPGRDGVVYATFEALAANNPVAYDYYTTIPNGVLNSDQQKWRKAQSR